MTLSQASLPLKQMVEQYLRQRRALGRGFEEEERVLRSLLEYLEAVSSDLDQTRFDQWCLSQEGVSANVRRNRQRIVRNFCLYRQRSDPGGFVPDPDRFPRREPYADPFIIGPEEVERMLSAARMLAATPTSPLYPDVMRMAVILLYCAGLRRGEVLRLLLSDVDPKEGVLRIRESKFHKSRLVPLSKSATRDLRLYLKKRLAPPLDPLPTSHLLVSRSYGRCHGYTGTGLRIGIQRLFHAAHVTGIDGRCPRVHDLRHSFAVQSLLRWYRSNADVPAKLPKLALYMGHVSIVSTAYYLRWISEIALEASRLFEAHSGHLITGGPHEIQDTPQ